MSYPQQGGGYGGYPSQQPPYGGQQPPYGGQQPAYGGQQPPYGGQQPPYGGQPPALGFDGINQPPGGMPPNQPPQQGGYNAPYPNASGGMPPSQQPPYGSQQPPYGGQAPYGQQPPYVGGQPPYGGQTQTPSFSGMAYAASAAASFQQFGGSNQPLSPGGGYQQPAPSGSYQPQPQSGSYQPQPQSGSYQPQPQSGAYQPPSGGGYQPPSTPQQVHTLPSTHTSTASSSSSSSSNQIPQEPPGQGTVKDVQPFDGQQDAEVLRKAMKGIGTNEKAITQIVGTRSNVQRQIVKLEFATLYGKDLLKELKGELSGNYESAVLALFMKPAEFDAHQLFTAMDGAGTDEKALIEILCTRSNSQIHAAAQAYKTMYKKELEKDLISETSGHFRRMLVSLVQGSRLENDPLDHNKAATDAKALYNAGEARWGTDESRFNVVLCSRSFPQLRLTFEEYGKISKRTMEKAIKSEMSGDIKDGMLSIVKAAKNRASYFAERLYLSMKGLGTNDRTLIRVMVSRCEVDMVQIKNEFQRAYGKTLASFIADDCSGDYKKLLLQLCGN